MACFYILSLAALAISVIQAVPFSPYGFQFGGLGGFPLPIQKQGFKKEPLTLTCFKSFLAGKDHPVVVDAIAVTIKEKQNPFANFHPNFFSYGGGASSLHGPGGLKASIDIFSKYGGKVVVAFTEKSRPERGCKPDDFGDFFTSKKQVGSFAGPFSNSFGSGYGPGLGGSFGGIQGFGAPGAFGSFSFGGPGHGFDKHESQIPGVISTVTLAPGTGSTINIDNLKGFTSLKELAGRGLVVCPVKNVDNDFYRARCDKEILSCCSLHYDMGKQVIEFGKPYDYEK